MKLHKIEIRNIRGIRKFTHDFDGKNAVIYGPNGAGKSSVLDAVDFLLTGNISRLAGEGTRGLSLRQHGANVAGASKAEDSYVSATVELPNHPIILSIKRRVADPHTLHVDEGAKLRMDAIQRQAVQGLHLLQRRQLLRFINTTSADRATRIQVLLNLEVVEETRKSLIRASNQFRNRSNESLKRHQRTYSEVATYLGQQSFTEKTALDAVNALRRELDLPRAGDLSKESILDGTGDYVTAQVEQPGAALFLEQMRDALEFLGPESLDRYRELEARLRQRLSTVRSNPSLVHSLDKAELVRRGISLISADSLPVV